MPLSWVELKRVGRLARRSRGEKVDNNLSFFLHRSRAILLVRVSSSLLHLGGLSMSVVRLCYMERAQSGARCLWCFRGSGLNQTRTATEASSPKIDSGTLVHFRLVLVIVLLDQAYQRGFDQCPFFSCLSCNVALTTGARRSRDLDSRSTCKLSSAGPQLPQMEGPRPTTQAFRAPGKPLIASRHHRSGRE